jgi:DNA mismatch repair protein MSH2
VSKDEKDLEAQRIANILDRCNVIPTERRKADFDAKNIAQDLNRLLEGDISVEALRKFIYRR